MRLVIGSDLDGCPSYMGVVQISWNWCSEGYENQEFQGVDGRGTEFPSPSMGGVQSHFWWEGYIGMSPVSKNSK